MKDNVRVISAAVFVVDQLLGGCAPPAAVSPRAPEAATPAPATPTEFCDGQVIQVNDGDDETNGDEGKVIFSQGTDVVRVEVYHHIADEYTAKLAVTRSDPEHPNAPPTKFSPTGAAINPRVSQQTLGWGGATVDVCQKPDQTFRYRVHPQEKQQLHNHQRRPR